MGNNMQKTSKITLIICVLICFTLTGPSFVSSVNAASMDSWTYGGPANDYTYGFVAATDGGYLMVGSTCSYGAGSSDIWLVKVDAHGTMLWNKTFGGPYTDYGCNIIATSDGNYALVGYTCYDNSTGGEECPDVWLIKVDANGNALWNQTYGKLADADYAMVIVATSDGGYALAGAIYQNVTSPGDALLIKVDANGAEQWNQTYGGANEDIFWGITQTSDGGYTLTGQTIIEDSVDAWVIKLDANGTEQWSKTFGGSESDIGWWIIKNSDESYTLSGCTASFGAGHNDFWLIKIDSSGNMLWNQTYGGPEDDIAYVLTATPDGGYAIVGSTISFGTAGSSDFWLVKTDSNGVIQWNQTCGGVDFDQGQWLSVTQDGVYAVAGVTASYGAGGTDGWLVISNAFESPESTPTPSTVAPTVTVTPTETPTPTTELMQDFTQLQTIIIGVIALIVVVTVVCVVFKKRK